MSFINQIIYPTAVEKQGRFFISEFFLQLFYFFVQGFVCFQMVDSFSDMHS